MFLIFIDLAIHPILTPTTLARQPNSIEILTFFADSMNEIIFKLLILNSVLNLGVKGCIIKP